MRALLVWMGVGLPVASRLSWEWCCRRGAYPALDSTIHTPLSAMEHLVHESESLVVSAGLPRFVRALAERAVDDGHGGSGYAAMVEQFRKPAGARP